MSNLLNGVLTALVTPLRRGTKGKIVVAREALEKNLAFQKSCGVSGVVPLGTTGESAAFPRPNHVHLLRQVIEVVDGGLFVLAGAGSNATEEAELSSKKAVGFGADGVLVVDCSYNKPSSDQLRRFYYEVIAGAVARENAEALVVPYIIPGRTGGSGLLPIDLARLARNSPNVRAVKEATGDLGRAAEIRKLLDPELEFSIFSGNDELTAEMMSSEGIKGGGAISVMSNIAPQAMVEMVEAFGSGEVNRGWEIHQCLCPLFNSVSVKVFDLEVFNGVGVIKHNVYPNPCAIKTMMAGLGIDSGLLFPPLGFMSKAGVQVVRSALRQVWENDAWILEPLADFYRVDVETRLADDGIWDGLSLS